jgi:hypothetical protein
LSISAYESLGWWATAYNSKNLHACLRLDLLEIIARDYLNGKMEDILGFESEYKERLDPGALKRFNDWQDRILREVPQLRRLSVEQLGTDLETYLHDDEKAEFSECVPHVAQWLRKCLDTGDIHLPYTYDTEVIHPMIRIESLIIEAYRRIDAERRKKE